MGHIFQCELVKSSKGDESYNYILAAQFDSNHNPTSVSATWFTIKVYARVILLLKKNRGNLNLQDILRPGR